VKLHAPTTGPPYLQVLTRRASSHGIDLRAFRPAERVEIGAT
jgi:hypothetical protein